MNVSAAAAPTVSAPSSRDSAALFADAQAKADRFELEGALDAARAALAAGTAHPDLTWSIYALLGRLQASMDRTTDAISDIGRALELSPNYTLDPSSSPRLLEPFEKARAATHPLGATVSSAASASGEIATTVEIRQDTWKLVRGARLYARDGGAFVRVVPLRSTAESVVWRCRGNCEHFVALTDAAGNELVFLGSPALPLTVAAHRAPAVPSTRAFYARPGIYLVAAGAFAVAGAYFGYRFASAQDALARTTQNRALHSYADALALDRDRRSSQVAAWALVAGAGITGGAAVILW